MPEPAAAEPPVLKEVNEPKAEAEKMKKIAAKPKHVDVIDILSSIITVRSKVAFDLTNKPKEIC
jgi:hypothetical protein